MNEVSKSSNQASQVDLWGMVLSGLCLIHCLLTPVALVVLPNLIPSWIQAESHGHHWFFVVLVLIAGFSIGAGFRRHRSWAPIYWLLAGLSVVAIATFGLDGNLEYGLTVVGSMLLLRGHYLNRQQCLLCENLSKKPACCDHD